MKLFIMRHEKRCLDDPSFESPLTVEGINNSVKFAEYAVKNLPTFTHIYTSPFLRCLQTFEPLLKKMEPLPVVRVDYSLHEYIHPDDKNSIKKISRISSDSKYLEYIDQYYVNATDSHEIKLRETVADVNLRVSSIKKTIKSAHVDTDDVVLIVTHMSIVNEFLGDQLDKFYPMGQITQIY